VPRLDRQNIGPAVCLVVLFLLAISGFLVSQRNPVPIGQGAIPGQSSGVYCNGDNGGATNGCTKSNASTERQANSDTEDCEPEKPRSQAREECLLTRYTGKLARYTLALFVATIVLGLVGAVGLGITGYQTWLGRQEFVASHRPKLRMRLLKMNPLEVDRPFSIGFSLVNIGDTPAYLTDIDITLRVVMIVRIEEGGDFRGYKDFISSEKIDRRDKIMPGASVRIEKPLEARFDPAWQQIPNGRWAEGRVAIIGTVTYADDREVERQTAFYRFCTEDVNRFRFADFDKATKRDREFED